MKRDEKMKCEVCGKKVKPGQSHNYTPSAGYFVPCPGSK
jgi:hypothetical protein